MQARHALVRRDGRWVCTACSLPRNTVYDPAPCPLCAGPMLPGHAITLSTDGRWYHDNPDCRPPQPLATARIAEDDSGTWSGQVSDGEVHRGEGAEGSVWGVHDYVPSYTMTVQQADDRDGPISLGPGGWCYTAGKSGFTGCGWYRVVQPLAELARHGWRTAWRPGVPPQAADGYNVITAQRLDKPKAGPLWRRLRLKHRLVYETDDDIFSVPPERWRNASYPQQVMWDVVSNCARVADRVTVSTQPLAEIYRNRVGCTDVRVIPNSVPDELLTMERPRHRRKVVIGWQGGGSHGPDLEMIAGPLRSTLDRLGKKAELHMYGCDFSDRIGRPARVTEWTPAGEDLEYYRKVDFDIALAPLRGTVFDSSKSAIKAVEAMALGIPVLASDCTPYRGVVADGVNGYLCRTGDDWRRRLRELAEDPEAREEMGAKGRQMAAEHTIGRVWPQWAEAYKDLQ